MADATDQEPVSVEEVSNDRLHGRFYRPLGTGPHHGVLVVHGSDPDAAFPDEYARRLATHGYAAFRIRYFDAPGLPDGLDSVPVEYFQRGIDWLLDREGVAGDRVGVVGWSRGSEATLLLATRDDRVGAVVGYVPSAYAFPGRPDTLDPVPPWTVDGDPVDPVPLYDGIEDDEDDPGVVLFRRTVERAPEDALRRAALPVEGIDGPVLLISGEEDRVWPSTEFAATLVDRLADCQRDWDHDHLAVEGAGHGIAVPYEPLEEQVVEYMGGTVPGTLHAAAVGWERTLDCLRRGLRERG